VSSPLPGARGSAATGRRLILASFADEEDLIAGVRAVQDRGWDIADVYAPYAVHGLEEALNWPRSRLPVACFLCGATGVGFALWFQFWTTAWNWPLNVGGRPWNSLPAFVPVTFECMVLLAGLGLVFAWLFRSGLYPGKEARLSLPGSTDDRFVLVVHGPSPKDSADAVMQVLQECGATVMDERSEEEQA
jgi:hypothetical protein